MMYLGLHFISACYLADFSSAASRCCPQEPMMNCGACRVKRGACTLPGGRARGGRTPASPHPDGRGHTYPRCGGERGEGSGGDGRGDLGCYDHGDPLDSPDLDMPTFSLGLTPPMQSYPSGLGTLYAPPPRGTVGSSI
ncbi:hypothetical protein M9H77_19000 [Catharanthus roseus]|uniref:Uncharacterized protein n=1 Tax=Catharanthus roseus TaxID=4058 RepID=A0ACC0B949_CATRO|nr:hypothetical protein M9H77_19000 [Catharanthus roseus]